MTLPAPQPKRCAIYTRKSSEEGLEQEFNSLHAQREACEAYIKSQKHEGWQLVKTAYDDGGISGGTMERPGLQLLLNDIRDGRIDIIVVYKVDRLTRALADFAKMVELFDKHNVSFVSVTQQFNTTSSMGRLTLNVLLSFAQFEREVTGERIRDKIAASKAKGMWMGGNVPIGYDTVDKKLVVNPQEAETVRLIFHAYLRLTCVRLLKKHLDERNIRNKNRIRKNGTVSEGARFSRGYLYHLLNNPIYIGQIRHKDIIHPGQHEAIIEPELWQAVQAMLSSRATRKVSAHKTESSPLTGKLFDAAGERLVPSHANKKGKRYRYYISHHLTTGLVDAARPHWRLPAKDIEKIIFHAIISMLADHTAISAALKSASVPARIIQAALKEAEHLHREAHLTQAKRIAMLERVEIREDGLCIRIQLTSLLPDGYETKPVLVRNIGMRMQRRGIETRLVIEGNNPSNVDPLLIRSIARARHLLQAIISGNKSIVAIAKQEKVSDRYIGNLLQLAFLAPDIIEAILVGRQPPELTKEELVKRIDIPMGWMVQKSKLLKN